MGHEKCKHTDDMAFGASIIAVYFISQSFLHGVTWLTIPRGWLGRIQKKVGNVFYPTLSQRFYYFPTFFNIYDLNSPKISYWFTRKRSFD